MFQADLAVSTSSSTTYELLALGTPIISIPVADNQKPIANSLRKRNAATVLERGLIKDEIHEAIENHIATPKLRRRRREKGRELVDGKGVKRIVTEILSVMGRDS